MPLTEIYHVYLNLLHIEAFLVIRREQEKLSTCFIFSEYSDRQPKIDGQKKMDPIHSCVYISNPST